MLRHASAQRGQCAAHRADWTSHDIPGLVRGRNLPNTAKPGCDRSSSQPGYHNEIIEGDVPLPAAYVGVFGNRVRPRFNFDLLTSKIHAASVRPDVKLLQFETTRETP